MRNPEYDRFGPWIIEISELDPPPPLFQPHLNKVETPLLSIKIPRNIERRNARPGMNLYDYMVTAYERELVILERVGDGVRSRAFAYEDIQFVRYGENLLKGSLHISVPDKAYDLPFNTVSKDIMRRLVDLIRARYASPDKVDTIAQFPVVTADKLSFFFIHLLADENTRRPDVRLLAAQPDTPVGSHESRTLYKLIFGTIGKTLLESLHLCDGREVKVISRGRTYRYVGQTVYGVNVLYLPISKLVNADCVEDRKNNAITNLVLETAGGSVTFALVRYNPSLSSYVDFLSTATTTAIALEDN